MKQLSKKLLLILLLPLLLSGCNATISLFDQHAYTQITSLKVDVLHMMDLATDPYENHKAEANEVMKSLEKAEEYEMHRPKNKISDEMWKIILDPQEGSVGGFMVLWKEESTKGKGLSATYISNKKLQVAKHFDKIAELESKKIKE